MVSYVWRIEVPQAHVPFYVVPTPQLMERLRRLERGNERAAMLGGDRPPSVLDVLAYLGKWEMLDLWSG